MRNRFDKLQYLHLNNNGNHVPHEHPAQDKLFKVWQILDGVVHCCQMEPLRQKDLSVYQAMIKFKWQLGIKQCMPMKPVKQGIKAWVCAKASSSSVCDFQVYTGMRNDGKAEQNLGYCKA